MRSILFYVNKISLCKANKTKNRHQDSVSFGATSCPIERGENTMKKIKMRKRIARLILCAMLLTSVGAFVNTDAAFAAGKEDEYADYTDKLVILFADPQRDGKGVEDKIEELRKIYENVGAEVISADFDIDKDGETNVNITGDMSDYLSVLGSSNQAVSLMQKILSKGFSNVEIIVIDNDTDVNDYLPKTVAQAEADKEAAEAEEREEITADKETENAEEEAEEVTADKEEAEAETEEVKEETEAEEVTADKEETAEEEIEEVKEETVSEEITADKEAEKDKEEEEEAKEEEADEVEEAGEEDKEEMVKSVEADVIVEEARAEAEEIVAEAKAEAEAIVEEAKKEIEELKAEAEAEAAELRESAKAEAAKDEAKEIVESAKAEAEEIVKSANAEAEEIVKSAKTEAKDTKAKEVVEVTDTEANDIVKAANEETAKAETVEGTSGDSYKVVKGDCLWNIARAHYGDGSKWVQIYQANANIISNPNLIYVGQTLVLP